MAWKGWCCDRCGRLITAIQEGWVEWLASENDDEEEVLSELQLVHRGSKCRVVRKVTSGPSCQLSAVNTGNTVETADGSRRKITGAQ